MKPAQAKAILQACLKRGWVIKGDKVFTPAQAASMQVIPAKKQRTVHNKTGWTDDTRNIRNKSNQADSFIRLVKQELEADVWPEFYFLTDREYRFDYAIPDHMIAIEQEGGVWAKGNSGHSSGRGIMRDMDKSSLANVNGWMLIRRTPDQVLTNETLELIKKAIETRKKLI